MIVAITVSIFGLMSGILIELYVTAGVPGALAVGICLGLAALIGSIEESARRIRMDE